MKILFILILTNIAWGQTIDIHFAMKRDDPLFKMIKKSSKVQKAFSQLKNIAESHNLKLNETVGANEDQLIKSLSDQDVLGVVWIGHSKGAYQDIGTNYNIFMLDSWGKYISKEIVSASHDGLAFFAINTCFMDDVKKHYQLEGHTFELLMNDSGESRELDAQLTNVLLGTIHIFNLTKEAINTIASTDREKKIAGEIQLTIKYRDLQSSQFGYDVLLNGHLIGVLDKEEAREHQGKVIKIKFSKKLLEDKNRLTIRATDPNRVSPTYQMPIDNIIVEYISLGNKTLFSGPVNIGDQDIVDIETGLSKIINRKTMRNMPFRNELNVEF